MSQHDSIQIDSDLLRNVVFVAVVVASENGALVARSRSAKYLGSLTEHSKGHFQFHHEDRDDNDDGLQFLV
jgi:hypothetical protein